MGSVEPDEQQLQSFLQDADDGTPVVMINLLRYRERAAYPDGFDAAPCTGREAYQRYGAVVVGLVGKAGGRILWTGDVQSTLIAPAGERWDDAVLVEHPSATAFIGMVSLPEYQAIVPHRTAALEDSRLIATWVGVDPTGRGGRGPAPRRTTRQHERAP
ncbi:MAG: DUF1330 domain-containing protein [Ilumatobacteraceae bacterium]